MQNNIKKSFLKFDMDFAFKVIAFILFCVYMAQLYVIYAIDFVQVFEPGMQVFMLYLRWTTIVISGVAVIVPFFGGKNLKAILCVFGPIVGILNLVLLKQNMDAWGYKDTFYPGWGDYGKYGIAYTPWRKVLFIIEQILILIISAYIIYKVIKNKEYKLFQPLKTILIFASLYLTFTYQSFLNILFGEYGDETTGFSTIHIIYLLSNLVLLLVSYFSMRHRNDEEKRVFFAILSCSGVFNYFNIKYGGLTGLPIHLCNTAIIMMFLAYIFKLKGIYYFTYFVNVIGALFAMLFPTCDTVDAFSLTTMHFWYNHVYAFCLPLLGVALKVYPRPTIKLMGKAIFWFSVYFLIAMCANVFITGFAGEETDYFFINSYFILDKLNINHSLMNNHKVLWEVKGYTLTLYPLMYFLVYIVYIGLMFVMWFIYDSCYKITDSHIALHNKKKLMKAQYEDLKKLLNGRKLEDPLYEEKKDMIEIKNFTKIYSGSEKPSVDNLNLTINGGEVYGFLGHNGAGKSTTIKSLVGIQSITSGQMIVEGYDVEKQPVEAKLQIGYVSDNHAVYERLTGREYINYIADLYMVSKEDRDARIEKYTKMFKLEDAIDREIKSYSHGMKQKIVVIASLIHDPKVWILDEPLTGLDPTSAFQIKECMREHASRGNIVFFSSHVIEVVEKVCTRICIISHGKLQCEYSLKDLKEKGISLEELYLKYVSSEEKIR